MKYLCCYIFVLIVCVNSTAQKISDKQLLVDNGLIDVQVGVAIPVMDFADKSFKRASGYAGIGYSARVGIRYDVAPLLGLGLHYQYFQNGFDESAYLSDLRSTFTDVTFNTFSSKPWVLQGVMLGAYVPYKSYRTSIDVGISGGILSGKYPENTVYFTTLPPSVSNWTATQYESTANNFGIQAGVKMRYKLYRNLMFSASADFTYCEIEFRDLQEIRSNGNAVQVYSLDSYTQYYHIIQVAAGIGLQVR